MEYIIPEMKEHRLTIFENNIPKQISRPKGDENGQCRRLRNEEFYSIYHSPNIIRINKSRRLKWAVHVARLEEGSPLKEFGASLILEVFQRW